MCAVQCTQNPAYIAYSLNLGFMLRSGTFGWRHSMCGTHFHITISRVNSHKIVPETDQEKKCPDPIRHLKIAFYPVFILFKILLPGKHSLGRGIWTPRHSKVQSVAISQKRSRGNCKFRSLKCLDILISISARGPTQGAQDLSQPHRRSYNTSIILS